MSLKDGNNAVCVVTPHDRGGHGEGGEEKERREGLQLHKSILLSACNFDFPK